MFKSLDLHKVQNFCRESPGPLLPNARRQGKGNGKTAVAVSSERRTIAKQQARPLEKPARAFKIHLGKQAAHLHTLILCVRGFDTCPHSQLTDSSAASAATALPLRRFPESSFQLLFPSSLERVWLLACLLLHCPKVQGRLMKSAPSALPKSHRAPLCRPGPP